jgi:hypothetical protein
MWLLQDNKTWPSGRCWPGCSYYDTLRMVLLLQSIRMRLRNKFIFNAKDSADDFHPDRL